MDKQELFNSICHQLNVDYNLDEDAYFEFSGAIKNLLENIQYVNALADEATNNLFFLAITYGQRDIGGSRCDYVSSDVLRAITKTAELSL